MQKRKPTLHELYLVSAPYLSSCGTSVTTGAFAGESEGCTLHTILHEVSYQFSLAYHGVS